MFTSCFVSQRRKRPQDIVNTMNPLQQFRYIRRFRNCQGRRKLKPCGKRSAAIASDRLS
jgi:hypothetical protein